MADQQTSLPTGTGSGLGSLKYPLQILSGPILFLLIMMIPLDGLKTEAHFALASFGWVIAWWVTAPIPWAISGLIPLALFPMFGVMKFKEAAGLYGQAVFFFLLGVMLFGHAFQKHGLGNRLAISFLAIPGVATSARRLILVLMGVEAIVSAFIDDAASIAIILPIGLAVAKHVGEASGKQPAELVKFYGATALGIFWASGAGGMVTPAGVPFNPLVISTLEELTKYKVSFAQWAAVGIVFAIVLVFVYWAVAMLMFPPEIKTVSIGTDYFANEKKKLGPFSTAEKGVLVVLLIMVLLWFLPAFFKMPKWLDIWIVPVIGTVLLFMIPTGGGKKDRLLIPKDFQEGVMWNILFLVLGGTAIASGLAKVGMVQWIQGALPSSLSPGALPWMAGILTPLLSHVSSGTATTAMMSSILFPIAVSLKFNPVILGRIIAGTAFGMSFPWCGAGSGTAFASGAIRFKDMFIGGVVITIVTTIVVVILSMIFVPLFGGFTAP